jgi:hypothetical protein
MVQSGLIHPGTLSSEPSATLTQQITLFHSSLCNNKPQHFTNWHPVKTNSTIKLHLLSVANTEQNVI